jgi:hypothetical protein
VARRGRNARLAGLGSRDMHRDSHRRVRGHPVVVRECSEFFSEISLGHPYFGTTLLDATN